MATPIVLCCVFLGDIIHPIFDVLMLCVFVTSVVCLICLCGDLVFLTSQMFLFAVVLGDDSLLFGNYVFLFREERLAIGNDIFLLANDMLLFDNGMYVLGNEMLLFRK